MSASVLDEPLNEIAIDAADLSDIYDRFAPEDELPTPEWLTQLALDTPRNSLRCLSSMTRFCKRLMDVVIAATMLILLSPVMLLVALAVRITSPGPIIFRQRRTGLDGEIIEVFKFRSMVTQDNDPVVQQATRNDPRITKFGAFIRKTSLDELPQFVNVLRGEMSIVGPRPHAVAHNEQYRKIVKAYMARHKVKPGITGWAQVNGWRGNTPLEKRIEYDLYYIENWSVRLDLKILWLTLVKGFFHKHAY